MKPILPVAALPVAALIATPVVAQQPERVRCSLDAAPAQPCRMTIETRGGVRHLGFTLGNGRHVSFVGRAQTGWWSGRLDGKPAMGWERNRGHVVFATADLSRRFAWYYPGSEHGRY